MPDFDLETRRRGTSEATVAIIGEVDIANASLLEAEIESAFQSGIRRVLVDLGGCRFIDSSGMAALIRPLQRTDRDAQAAEIERRWLALVDPCNQVRRTIEIAGLTTILPVFESLQEARNAT